MRTASRIAARFRSLFSRPAVPSAPAGWRSITATDAADVFLVAYPKSGITWLQAMVAGAIYGLDPERAPDTLVQDLVPDVHYKPFYKRYRTPMFFKTHHLPRPEYRRVVYLLRDGRDVLVSYWHHLKVLERREVDFAAMIAGEGLFPCKWREHVEAWMENPHGAELLVIRYEDMKADAVKELVRLCNFVREWHEADELAQVAAKCSFAAMQRREERLGWDNPEWPTDRPFVRRGETGSYRDEMPADSLAAFMAEAGATLRKNGFTS